MLRKVNKNQILLFFLLFAFWLVIAPTIDLVQIIVGGLVALSITIYSFDTEKPNNQQKLTLKYFIALIVFGFKLVYEIIKANIDVAKLVLAPKLKIQPQFKKIRNPMKSDLNKVIYGNSITLTPGTITVELENDYIIIHALTDSAANEAEGGSLETAVKKLEVNIWVIY